MRRFNLYVDGNWTLCEMRGGVPVSGVASEPGYTTLMEDVAVLDGAEVPYGSCRLNARGLVNMADRYPAAEFEMDGGVEVASVAEALEGTRLFGLYVGGEDASL